MLSQEAAGRNSRPLKPMRQGPSLGHRGNIRATCSCLLLLRVSRGKCQPGGHLVWPPGVFCPTLGEIFGLSPFMTHDPVRTQLQVLRSLGFGFLEGIERTSAAESPEPAPPGAEAGDLAGPMAFEGPPLALEERVARLQAIGEETAACAKCRLHLGRSRSVPGEGDPMAGLMFVGEGPGFHEDQQGRPFVGPAGELLTKIIEAMQFRREEVFIANVVKCRPPQNRQPEPDEMACCLPYLERQIDVIRPRAIVTLGKTALMGLMPEHAHSSMTRVRGQWLDYAGIPVMPTFHPAYLLRSPQQKRLVWEDMQKVMKLFGKQPAKRSD